MSARLAREAPSSAAPLPRANPLLLGHSQALRQTEEWLASGVLPQALMICGPWGIGKATLAFRIARMLLRRPEPAALLFGEAPPAAPQTDGAGVDWPSDEASRWVVAGTHPDLLTIERRFDEKKGRAATDIVVDDVRRIGAFLASSPAAGGWRVVVVDAADDMNRNAANALLKVLEEPGRNSLIVLVSHQPSRLPATVRSRCRKLLLGPLADDVLATLVSRFLPELPAPEQALLCTLAEGSIGRALLLARHDGTAAFRTIGGFFEALAGGSGARHLGSWLNDPALGGDEDGFRVTAHVLDWWLRRIAAAGLGAGPEGAESIGPAGATAHRLATAAPLDRWLKVWDKTQHLLAQAAHGNLDRRQALVTALLHVQTDVLPLSH